MWWWWWRRQTTSTSTPRWQTKNNNKNQWQLTNENIRWTKCRKESERKRPTFTQTSVTYTENRLNHYIQFRQTHFGWKPLTWQRPLLPPPPPPPPSPHNNRSKHKLKQWTKEVKIELAFEALRRRSASLATAHPLSRLKADESASTSTHVIDALSFPSISHNFAESGLPFRWSGFHSHAERFHFRS